MAKRRRFIDEEKIFEDDFSDINRKKRGVVCHASLVRVRKEPNGTSSTIKVLEQGDEVTIIGKSTETFYKIDLGGSIGYISCNYCEEVS